MCHCEYTQNCPRNQLQKRTDKAESLGLEFMSFLFILNVPEEQQVLRTERDYPALERRQV